LGIESGVDLETLIGVVKKVEKAVGRSLPGQLAKAGPRLNLHSRP